MSTRHMPRRECFVIMPYAKEFEATYEEAIRPAVEACGLKCVRADKKLEAGTAFDLLQADIRRSAVCVADVSGPNPNVVMEVGIALTLGKPVVMVSRDELRQLPFDLRHFKVMHYDPKDDGHAILRRHLEEGLDRTVGLGTDQREVDLLKEMLVPPSLPDAGPHVVAASPLSYRRARSLHQGFLSLRGTSADHEGIRSLIHSFGVMRGVNTLPDLINPDDYDDSAVSNPDTPMNLYCIGAPKSNRWTGLMMRALYERWGPPLEFRADPDSDDLRDVQVNVTRDRTLYQPPGFRKCPHSVWDFGLLIRAPHPVFRDRMLLILAGRSAVGTHAASVAATDAQHIQRIKTLLAEESVDLCDHTKPFWAVAHMACLKEPGQDAAFDLASLRISVVERFRPVSRA